MHCDVPSLSQLTAFHVFWKIYHHSAKITVSWQDKIFDYIPEPQLTKFSHCSSDSHQNGKLQPTPTLALTLQPQFLPQHLWIDLAFHDHKIWLSTSNVNPQSHYTPRSPVLDSPFPDGGSKHSQRWWTLPQQAGPVQAAGELARHQHQTELVVNLENRAEWYMCFTRFRQYLRGAQILC